jgi:GAF domain-containing protein
MTVPLPMHPDPHTYQWTDAEIATMREYAAAVSAADNAALREALQYAIKQVPELATVLGWHAQH